MRLDARSPRRALIGLTPLIDVVFILLLFFMLTTRLDRQQATTIDVLAPAAPTPVAASSRRLRIDGDGLLVLWDDRRVALERIGELSELHRLREAGASLRLDVADELALQRVVAWMDAFDRFGIASVSITGMVR